MTPPCFVVLEGPDGTGKSTLAEALAGEFARRGLPPVRVRDPGGTALGDAARDWLLHCDGGGDNGRDGGPSVAPSAELYLFLAARAQLVHEIIAPAMAAGRAVLADRFWLSTLAYQGALPAVRAAWTPEEFRRLVRAGLAAEPTHWLLLDASVAVGRARRGRDRDRLERRDDAYFEAVRARYREEAAHLPPGRVCRLDATPPPEAVAAAAIRFLFPDPA